MSSILSAFTLNPKTPTDFDRFAPVNSIKIDELVFTLTSGSEGGPIARSTVISRSATKPGGTLTHPEGSLISFRGKVVSTQKLTDAHISLANHILTDCEGDVDADITLFLEILGRQVDYYVIVHDTKTITWMTGQAPDSFKNPSRTKHEHEYWIHMENFPGPHFSTAEDLRLLKHVLGSNAIDALTSEGSTSPMSVKQIQTHLAMLDKFSTEGDIYQTYAIARLWGLILQSRVINKYGTPEARLDRFITITDNPPAFAGGYATLSRFMLGIPRTHLARCSKAWADRIAYTEEWRRFKATNQQEWQQVMYLACVLAIASLLVGKQNSFLFGIPPKTALLTALASAATAYYLLNESQNLGDHAADASVYFQEREEILFGVQRIAIVNSAPQALLAWAFMLFLSSIVCI